MLAGLSSLAENLVSWKGFFLDLIRVYQDIMYPIYGWLILWLPFNFPLWINDYLTTGILIGTSYTQAILITEKSNSRFSSFTEKILLSVPLTFIMMFIWPLFLVPLLAPLIKAGEMESFRSKSLLTWLCLAIILILLIVMIAVNLALYHR